MTAANQTKGFVYVAAESDDVMRGAAVGATVRLPSRSPPWIVVDRSLETLLVTKWPGRVWFVEILEEVSESDQVAAGAGTLVKNVWYKRAWAVRVIEEIPSSNLFGAAGKSVCAIIDRAARLEVDQVAALNAARDSRASSAYDEAWRKWLGGRYAEYGQVKEFAGVLGISTPGGASSPINYGLSLISSTIYTRARTLLGDSAFHLDDDGEEQLDENWARAANALLEAAIAYGAPSLVDGDQRSVLSQAWRKVFGFVRL